MKPVLHTHRLTLIPFDVSDVDISLELFTNPKVLRFAGGVMDEDEIRAQMPNWLRRGGNGCIGIWCITDKHSGEKLGTGALLPMPIEEDDTDFELVEPHIMPEGDVEVGYFLKPSAWGRGFATEACKRLLQLAFEESSLTEIVATFDLGNEASRRVLLKSGFVDHGMRRCYAEEGPDFRITRKDWLESRQGI
jgi:RimJ/RimL family protein N-acetyltransferase